MKRASKAAEYAAKKHYTSYSKKRRNSAFRSWDFVRALNYEPDGCWTVRFFRRYKKGRFYFTDRMPVGWSAGFGKAWLLT